MTATLNGLAIRKRLGRETWNVPLPFGDDGWLLDSKTKRMRIIVTADAPVPEFEGWWHASISRRDRIPEYEDLARLHKAVWPEGYAYQVFAPPSAHINIHAHALHLWGKADGSIVLPDFGKYGTI